VNFNKFLEFAKIHSAILGLFLHRQWRFAKTHNQKQNVMLRGAVTGP